MLFRRKSKVASEPASEPAFEPVPIFGNGEPDMRALGRILWQKKDKIVAITLVVAVAAFVVVNLITPQYRSEARLLLEARENVFLRAEADKNVASTTIDAEAVASQIQVVLSRDLAREVIKKEKLDTLPEFDPSLNRFSTLRVVLGLFGVGRDLSSMSREERTLEAYYDHLNVFAVEKSRVIAIDFNSANPELASRVANTIAATYLRMQQAAKQNQTRAAGDWLSGEITNLRKKVAASEAKVEQYRNKSSLFVGTNNTLLPNQQLGEINSQIAAARGQKADLEARARQLRDLIRSGKPIEFLRHRQHRIDAPAGRNAQHATFAARRAVDHAARQASAHQGASCASRRGRTRNPQRRRPSGQPTRQRREGCRRSGRDAHRQS